MATYSSILAWKIPMDRGAWWAIVHRVTKIGHNWSDLAHKQLVVLPSGSVVKNLPANAGDTKDAGLIPGSGRSPGVGNGNPLQHSCWKIPRTEEPGGLLSMGSQRVRHDWATEHAGTHTQDTKLIHRNRLHSYTLTVKNQKKKFRKQSHSPLQ